MNKKIFWVTSYPKSGNTWMRAILASFFFTKNGIFEFKFISYIPNFEKKNTFEFIKHLNINDYNNLDDLKILSKYWIESQNRIKINGDFSFFKSHSANMSLFNYPFTNEASSLGLIYLVRDPRDIAISYSKHQRKNLDQIIKLMTTTGAISFTNNKEGVNYPVMISRWDEHYISWKALKVPKIIIKYEKLLNDTKNVLEKINDFFQQNYNITIKNKKEKIENIIKSTNFKILQNYEKKYGFNEATKSAFFRNGKEGQWKNKLSKNQIEKIENTFNKTMKELGYL